MDVLGRSVAAAQSPCSEGCWWSGMAGKPVLRAARSEHEGDLQTRMAWTLCRSEIGQAAQVEVCAVLQVLASPDSREGQGILQVLLDEQAQSDGPDACLSCRVVQSFGSQI